MWYLIVYISIYGWLGWGRVPTNPVWLGWDCKSTYLVRWVWCQVPANLDGWVEATCQQTRYGWVEVKDQQTLYACLYYICACLYYGVFGKLTKLCHTVWISMFLVLLMSRERRRRDCTHHRAVYVNWYFVLIFWLNMICKQCFDNFWAYGFAF